MTGVGWDGSGIGRLPVLNDARCTGCGDCVRVCPARCLERLGGRAWLPRPADCLTCGACAAVCLADAIRMPPVSDSPAGT